MNIPVLEINQFKKSKPFDGFYINQFSEHLDKNKTLVNRPHRHNFYLCVLFIKGSGKHEVDFESYSISPGTVFFLRPGQSHFWRFESEPEGIIFFHSQDFFDLNFLEHKLNTYPFFGSLQNPPVVEIPLDEADKLYNRLVEVHGEYRKGDVLAESKIISLVNVVYIDLMRKYITSAISSKKQPTSYMSILIRFERHINEHFQDERLPKFYADLLNISTKHLNRVVKYTLNKTASELIAERLILEAKRLIVHSGNDLLQISDSLKFSEYSYFSKFFKLKTGLSPSVFRKKYLVHGPLRY